MTMNAWVRWTHRWMGLALTLTVLANFIVMSFGQPPAWVVYAPLPPLALLLITGLYMFFRHYFGRAQAAPRAGAGSSFQ